MRAVVSVLQLLHVDAVSVAHALDDELEDDGPGGPNVVGVLLAERRLPRQVKTFGEDVEEDQFAAGDRGVLRAYDRVTGVCGWEKSSHFLNYVTVRIYCI